LIGNHFIFLGAFKRRRGAFKHCLIPKTGVPAWSLAQGIGVLLRDALPLRLAADRQGEPNDIRRYVVRAAPSEF
jgi:hypothetical protein